MSVMATEQFSHYIKAGLKKKGEFIFFFEDLKRKQICSCLQLYVAQVCREPYNQYRGAYSRYRGRYSRCAQVQPFNSKKLHGVEREENATSIVSGS